MIIYFIAIFLIFLISFLFESVFKNLRHRKIWESISAGIIVFLLLSLKKATVGQDTPTYKAAYEWTTTVGWGGLSSNYSSFEISFRYLMKTFSSFQLPFTLFASFIYFLLCIGLFFLFNRYCDIPSFAWLFFLCFGSFTFIASALRQCLAISLTIFSILIFQKQKWWSWAVAIGLLSLAYLFHHSALIFLALIPGLFFKLRTNCFSSLFTALVICALFSFPIITMLLFVYPFNRLINTPYVDVSSGGISGSAIAILLIVLFALFFLPKNEFQTSINQKFPHWKLIERLPEPGNRFSPNHNDSLLLWASILTILLLVISNKHSLIGRFSEYFRFYIGPLFVNTLFRQENKTIRVLAFFLLPIFLGAYFYYTTIRTGYLRLTPYSFFWQQ